MPKNEASSGANGACALSRICENALLRATQAGAAGVEAGGASAASAAGTAGAERPMARATAKLSGKAFMAGSGGRGRRSIAPPRRPRHTPKVTRQRAPCPNSTFFSASDIGLPASGFTCFDKA